MTIVRRIVERVGAGLRASHEALERWQARRRRLRHLERVFG